MARPSARSERIAEKLVLLEENGDILLNRLYVIKKELALADKRPQLFKDKATESLLKAVTKKFDSKSKRYFQLGSFESKLQVDKILTPHTNDLLSFLEPFYLLILDVADYKDLVFETLSTISVLKMNLDLTINFDLTKTYLNLIVNIFSIIYLISNIEDRKVLLGLYNLAHELRQGTGHSSFLRLRELILDYDSPLRKLNEKFVPHAGTITLAIKSLDGSFRKKLSSFNDILFHQTMFMLAESNRLTDPEVGITARCDTIPIEMMERWIVVCLAICHQQLQLGQDIHQLWRLALTNSFVLPLYRDEVIPTHLALQSYFDQVRGYSKRVGELKEWWNVAIKEAPVEHRGKRRCLRIILKEMYFVLSDQPGLLGPKCATVLTALNCASYEVEWLIRHRVNVPKAAQKQLHAATGAGEEILVDRQLPELLFYMEELRCLLRTYAHLVQRYSGAFLLTYYAPACANFGKPLQVVSEDEVGEMTNILVSTLKSLSLQQIDAGQPPNLTAFRLDWFRVQASTSSVHAAVQLRSPNVLPVARYLNGAVFYSELVDKLENKIRQSADLSVYGVYPTQLDLQFNQCLQNTSQLRYAISYAQVAAHFTNRCHEKCPEDLAKKGELGLKKATSLLRRLTSMCIQLIQSLIDEMCNLDDHCLPKTAVPRAVAVLRANSKHIAKGVISGNDTAKGPLTETNSSPFADKLPGHESLRSNRADTTKRDQLHYAISDLLSSLSHCPVINFYQHKFVPVEFFQSELELQLHKWLVQLTMFPGAQGCMEIAKPSELLHCLKSLITTVTSLDSYVNVDIIRILRAILPCQSQLLNGNTGAATITYNYTAWYIEAFLRLAKSGSITYSPLRRAFIGWSSMSSGSKNDGSGNNDGVTPTFSADEFSDVNELYALAEIIGPLGVSAMSDQINQNIASLIKELLDLVSENAAILDQIRSSESQPHKLRELCSQLTGQEGATSRLRIIGVCYAFRSLLQDALASVLQLRMPYLMKAIQDLRNDLPGGQESLELSELSVAAGLRCRVDASLVRALKFNEITPSEELDSLLMIYIAVSVPYLARSSDGESAYQLNLDAFLQNSHCAVTAIGLLLAALFSFHHNKEGMEQRANELLTLSSNVALQAFPDVNAGNEYLQSHSREITLAMLELLTESCSYLSLDRLESCCPYVLLHQIHGKMMGH